MRARYITIGGYHCENDFECTLARFSKTAPELQKYKIQIPGKNGDEDFTESLTGRPTYGNRTLTIVLLCLAHWSRREEITSKILNAVHGKMVNVVLSDDSRYYWSGRCEMVGEPEVKGTAMSITLEVDAYPFKRSIAENELFSVTPTVTSSTSTIPGLGTIRSYKTSEFTRTITLQNQSILTFWRTGNYWGGSMSIKCGEYSFSLDSNAVSDNKYNTSVLLPAGTYTLEFGSVVLGGTSGQSTTIKCGYWEAKM